MDGSSRREAKKSWNAVGVGGKRASPILPWGCALIEGEVI